MQYDTFDLQRSNKAHIDSPEHYIVVHDGTVYLRILGQEGFYQVITATSGEDSGDFAAFGDQGALNTAAVGVAEKIDCKPLLKLDFHKRPYVQICECEFLSDAHRAAVVLFQVLVQQRSEPSVTTL